MNREQTPKGQARSAIPDVGSIYLAALRRHLAEDREETLLEAGEIGWTAISEGYSLRAMAEIHQRALAAIRHSAGPCREGQSASPEAAGAFFATSIAPFEGNALERAPDSADLRYQNRALREQVCRMRNRIYDSTLQLIAAIHLAVGDVAAIDTGDAPAALSRLTSTLERVDLELRNAAPEPLLGADLDRGQVADCPAQRQRTVAGDGTSLPAFIECLG